MRRPLAVLALLLTAVTAGSGFPVEPGPSPEIAGLHDRRGPEIFRIRVENRADGKIDVSRDRGESWLTVGRVVAPADAVNPLGYTASKWAADSAVAASAVNAIHLKVANHPETGRGIITSLMPAGEPVGAAAAGQRTGILTDLSPGTGIFGGGLAPYVNSPVFLVHNEDLIPLGEDWVPSIGDVLVIEVNAPERGIRWLEFENRFGGLVRVSFSDGGEEVIGAVLRPVIGIGRFEGTRDAAPGRIRANHPGVLDVSTSPLGAVGGFQIVPSGHAGSPETGYIRTGTQWMVIGPIDVTQPTWEGVAPLFAGYLRPDYRPDDIGQEDWMRRLLSRSQVRVRFGGGDWEAMPRIGIDPEAPEDAPDRARGREGLWRIAGSLQPHIAPPAISNVALQGITHIRIILPRAQYWPEPVEDNLW